MGLRSRILRLLGATRAVPPTASTDASAEHRWLRDAAASGVVAVRGRAVEAHGPAPWSYVVAGGERHVVQLGLRTVVVLAEGRLATPAVARHIFETYRAARARAGGTGLTAVIDLRRLTGTNLATVRAVLENIRLDNDPRDLTVLIFSASSRWLSAVIGSQWLGAGRFESTTAPLQEVLARVLSGANGYPDAELFAPRDALRESTLHALVRITLDHDAPLPAPPPTSDPLAVDLFHAMRAMQEELRELHRAQREAQEALEAKVRERTAALAAAKEQADRAVMAQQAFLSTMNHEVRTPLHGILGAARLMESWAVAPEQRELLDTLLFSAQHLQSLVDDVLDYAKIEAGALELDLVPMDLHRMVAGVARAFGVRAREKNVTLAATTDPLVPRSLRGDAVRVNQVLFNLVGNAVKFTDEGQVTLRVDLVEEGPERVAVAVRVVDTGPGIDAAHLATLFEPFSTATRDTARRYGGTGLGLAISRRLARLHGGDIEVVTAPGQGACFTMRLSLERVSTQPRLAAAPARDLRGLRVLLVEDNPVNQIVVTRFLRLWNVDVTTVDDGVQGVARAAAERFDVVLLDLHMPVMDGFEALAQMRARADVPPILALSADASDTTRARVMEAGASGFVSKPFQPDDLYERLATLRLSAEAAAAAQAAAAAPTG
jgi:signal transduction histidine kinase/ActR/RegA family two-component response regulator